MAISYSSKVDIRGNALEPIYAELLYMNKTVGEQLVTFADDIKAETIITETSQTAPFQAYSSGAPSSSGTLTLADTTITPTKIMMYQEFDYETLRTSRFKRGMRAGAWEIVSDEFARWVLDNVSGEVSQNAESLFWNAATSATKTAVAALTPGTGQTSVGAAEQTYVAAAPSGLIDGIVTRMIYNNAAVGGRVKVAGTTISNSNIAAEYAKAYEALPAINLHTGGNLPFIYAPFSHKQFINIYNINATYRDLFSVQGDRYFYNGLEIKFVPLPENCIIIAKPDHLLWCTDLTSDIQKLVIDKIANNREDYFCKAIFTQFAHVVRQAMNVLYLG